MISKNKIKLIRSLDNKKSRIEENLFVVEGDKSIIDLLESDFVVSELFITEKLNQQLKPEKKISAQIHLTDYDHIKKASLLKNPQNGIALVKIKEQTIPRTFKGLVLYLDGIQNPGNLGTIIRTAHWFGIEHVICSTDTVDYLNPKSIQASMGSFCFVNVYYADLLTLFAKSYFTDYLTVGTFPDGESIYKTQFPIETLLIIGNEGSGISPNLFPKIEKRISIPLMSKTVSAPDSLNAAIAASVICSEIKRNETQHSIQNETES